MTRHVTVQYYAQLREERGLSLESVETGAATPRDLYAELQARYGFSLSADRLKVAINDAFGDWDQPLTASDRVVFIPPVAGG